MAAATKRSMHLVEEGWLALSETIMAHTSGLEEEKARDVFYFGALHLWSTIAIMIGQGEDTRTKNRKLAMIHAELSTFADGMVSGKSRTRKH